MGTAVERIERLYAHHASKDVSFHVLLETLPEVLGDDELADVIESDGRVRLRMGLPVTLERYIDAVPDLRQRPDSLDAAIDVSLRARSGTSRFDQHVVEIFCSDYPELSDAIRETALLNNSIYSTNGLRERVAANSKRDLPCDFGPTLPDGVQRYRLTELLGTGAAGEVFLAVDRQLSDETHDALVAIKVFPDAARNPLHRTRRMDEAAKARRIEHANVVRILDRGTTDEQEDYLVYEYVDGGDLHQWLQTNQVPLPPREAAALVAKIARGVQAAHNAGLVHCDLKPGNILMTAEGEPKITDFGVAARLSDAREMDDDTPLGNLAFMSPEQFHMEEGALTPPTDVYALGGLLFYLLTGRMLNGSTVEEIRHTHESGAYRTPTEQFGSKIKRSLRPLLRICDRACARDLRERIQSADAMSTDLQSWLRFEPIAWQNPHLTTRTALVVRRKPITSALVGLVVILCAAAGWLGYWGLDPAAHVQSIIDSGLGSLHRYTEYVLKHGRARTDILPFIWQSQFLEGTAVNPTPTTEWQRRVLLMKVLDKMAQGAIEEGRPDHLDTLSLRTASVYWKIAIYRGGEETLQEVDDLTSIWRERLVDGDRWIDYMDAMRLCNELQIIRTRVGVRGYLDEEDRQLVQEIVKGLVEAEDLLSGLDRSTPLHLLVIEHIRMAFAPKLLNDSSRWQEAERYRQIISGDRPVSLEGLERTIWRQEYFGSVGLNLDDPENSDSANFEGFRLMLSTDRTTPAYGE